VYNKAGDWKLCALVRVKTPENQMWYFYKGFLRIYGATFKSFSLSISFFKRKTYLVGGLEVLVGVAGVVAVLVGCCSLSAVFSSRVSYRSKGRCSAIDKWRLTGWKSWVELTVGQSSGERVDAVEDDGACDRGRSINIWVFLEKAHAYVVATNRQCRRGPWGGLEQESQQSGTESK
jgi:hypothetical protein